MKVLVIGAAGFVGSHTVDRLLAEQHEVIGLDNLRTGKLENLQDALASNRFRFVQADAATPGTLNDLFASEKPDSVIHLAALVSVMEGLANPDLNFELNVRLTHLVAEAMRRNQIPHLVFASSAAIYGDPAEFPVKESTPAAPVSPYGGAKLASENLLLTHARAYGFSAVCLRYFNIYGPRQDPSSPYSGVISIFARRSKEGQSVAIYGDGEQTRDFVHVSDIAKANVLAAQCRGASPAAYNVCTGKTTSLIRLLEIVRAKIPAAPAPTFAPARAGEIRHSSADPEPAFKALGFQAAVKIEDGIPLLLDSLR